MARFNCTQPALATRQSSQVAAEALSAMEHEEQAEAPGGPGWFDSSRELVRGLDVTESAPGDAALNEWVRLCFAR